MLRPFTSESSLLPQALDWDAPLDFRYREADALWHAAWTAECGWEKGQLYEHQGATLEVSPGATALHYGQAIIEGLRAYRSRDGKVLLFRPVDHGRRLRQSAAALVMEAPPVEVFLEAVKAVVRANVRWIPRYGRGSLYIRPVLFGSGTALGVSPADEYRFCVFTSPVGQYLGGSRLLVLPMAHRAAPFGIGSAKAAGNYSACLRPSKLAKDAGYADVLYLDAREDKYVEELSGASFLAILKDGTLVAPPLGSILPGVTRDSILTVARELFGWVVAQRWVPIEEVIHDAAEAFYTGTATILSPVTTIGYHGADHPIGDGKPGPRAAMLRKALQGIQLQERPDLWGWVMDVSI